MRSHFFRTVCFCLCLFALPAVAIDSIEEYNQLLPVWGTSWKRGDSGHHISSYYPSFYTGFAPRSSYPDRVHIRTSRGNQTRVSVILDDETVRDYMFDLVKRADFYKLMTTPRDGGQKSYLNTSPKGASFIDQALLFDQIIESNKYQIRPTVAVATTDTVMTEVFYIQSVGLIESLNPGRFFWIDIDLQKEFDRWQSVLMTVLEGRSPEQVLTSRSTQLMVAINTLVWGRVNYTATPSEALVQQVQNTARLAVGGAKKDFYASAFELFKSVTGDKYNFKTVSVSGVWQEALSCTSEACTLRYPELTTIYPTGSYTGSTRDEFNNRIPEFATPGLWSFLDRAYHDVDHIRKEPYYGWAPKMDFEGIGNGFHNPAVRFNGSNFSKSVKEALMAPQDHTELWAVKRGNVSSGCLRLSLGHVWEMRHIMPVQNDKMKMVYFFGNASADYDVYDINGDGDLEVMGLEYQISYDTKGASGLDKREGEELSLGSEDRESYYLDLYGKKVFSLLDNYFYFSNPKVSFPSHLDYQKKKTTTSLVVQGEIPLYEQVYEQDKVQFYMPITTQDIGSGGKEAISKRLIRLMGRVRGCAPTTDKNICGEQAFETEKSDVIEKL